MEKSINALLDSNLRVIIPDFGAFIIRQKDPRIIVFNEFLRYNDGRLTEYISRTEGIDQETALQQVSDFTVSINKVLDTGKPYTLKGLGQLHKDSSGKIIFIFESKINTPDPAEPDESEQPAIKTDNFKSRSKGKPKRIPESKTEPVEEISAPVPEVPEVPEKEEILLQDTLEIGSAIEKPAFISFNLILKWIVVILLINAVILGWFIFGDSIRGLFRKKAEPVDMMDSLFNNLSDSVKEAAFDTAIVFDEISEISSVAEPDAAEGNFRYYIVAGCFRDEVNADDLVRSLKSRGFNAEKFGKIGNLYAVSFASFDNKEPAVKELKRIREEMQPEAWMTGF